MPMSIYAYICIAYNSTCTVRARTPFRPLVSARVKASVRAFVRASVRPCVRASEDPSVVV